MAKGAMGVDPKKTKLKSPEELGLSRVSPGVYRDKYGNLTNSSGKVTRYASNNKDKRSIANPAPAKPTQPAPTQPTVTQPEQAPAPTISTGQEQMPGNPAFGIRPEIIRTPEQVTQDLYGGAGDFYGRYNPLDIGSMVQPQFTQQMQQASNTIYDEFSRRAEPEFQRQIAAKEQELFERGIDPSNENYKLQMDQLVRQQNDARQSMSSQATQQGMGYQQQLFNQGQSIYGQPASVASTLGQPYLQGMQNQAAINQIMAEYGQRGELMEQEQAGQERQNLQKYGFETQLLAKELANRLKIARMQNRGGGGGQSGNDAALLGNWIGGYDNPTGPPPKTNPINDVVGGFVGGVGGGLVKLIGS